LREGALDLPGLGTLNFVRNKSARILGPMSEKLGKMEKDDAFYKLRDEYLKLLEQTAKLEVHGDTKKLTVSLINPELSSAQFSYGRLKVELKGVTIENASVDLPPLKSLFDQIDKGTLKPVFHLKGIGAEKIVLTDEQTGISTTITNGKIGAIDILSPQ